MMHWNGIVGQNAVHAYTQWVYLVKGHLYTQARVRLGLVVVHDNYTVQFGCRPIAWWLYQSRGEAARLLRVCPMALGCRLSPL